MLPAQSVSQDSTRTLSVKIKTLTLDLETENLDPFHNKILLLGYRYNADGPVQQVRFYNREKPNEDFIRALANPTVLKRGHNCHFDLLCLAASGYTVNGPIDDTRILAYLQDPTQELDLKTLVEKKLHRKVVRMEDFGRNRLPNKMVKNHPRLVSNLVKSGKFWVSKKTLETYNVADVINCDDLRRELINTRWYQSVEQPLSEVLFKAEQKGIQLDLAHLRGLDNEFKEKIENLRRDLGMEFNPASPIQVKSKFKENGLSLETTDRHTLKKISWAEGPNSKTGILARKLLEFRGLSKLRGTYIEPFLQQADANGRIHGRFNQAGRESTSLGDIKGTATGRLSSSDPNLQNIPDRTEEGRRVRKGIIATPGLILIDSDLKQIEPRLVAHYTQSKVLLNAFEKQLDTHAIMGGLIFNKSPESLTKLERFIGKTSWLATAYGAWYKKLRLIVEVNSEDPVFYDDEFYKKVQAAFWQANPEIRAWRERHISTVRNTGYIETIGGRVIHIDGLNSHNEWQRNEAERLVVNYQIQASAADVAKIVVVNTAQQLKDNYLLAVVHDEQLSETSNKDNIQKINYITENSVKLQNVAILADTRIIQSWAEK